MANSAEFRDLIYRSADPTAPINDNTKVDRLLGIKPNGEAVVVDISGNNTVALRSDAPDIEVVTYRDYYDHHNDHYDKDDEVYSCRATEQLVSSSVPSLIYANDADNYGWTFEESKTIDWDMVYTCAAVNRLIDEKISGGSPVVNPGNNEESGGLTIGDVRTAILESNYESSQQSNDKTYTCKAIRTYIQEVVSNLPSNPGGQTTTDTFWMADSTDSNLIKPKNSKGISTGGQNLKIGDGSINFSNNISVSVGTWDGESWLTVPNTRCTSSLVAEGTLVAKGTLTVSNGGSVKGDFKISSSSGPTLTVQGAIETGSGGATIHSPMLKLALSSSVSADITYDGQKVNVSAPLYASSFYESSDITLKENVAPVSDRALSAASSIPLVEFDWKSTGKHSYGTIAQEVAKVMPEIVETDEEGKKSVNYIALLCAKVAALEKEVAQLKANQNG